MFRCVIYIIFRKYLLLFAQQLLFSTKYYVCYIGCAVDCNLYVFMDLQCIYNDRNSAFNSYFFMLNILKSIIEILYL